MGSHGGQELNQSATAVRTCRILYYGPSGAGKRDNLRQIADSIPQESLLRATADDPTRNIAFRLRSADQGDWTVLIQAMDTTREIYPSKVQKSNPPFDGVVFLAQSAAARLDQSLSSLEALKVYIDSWGLDIMSVPMVIQYNRLGDAGCLPVDRLESLLNPWGLLSFPACTEQGEGVKETLKAILSLTMSHLVQKMASGTAAGTQPAPAPGASSAPGANGFESGPTNSTLLETPGLEPAGDTSGFQVVSEDRTGFFFDELRPPIVIPVRIPRKLMEKYGSARVILEIELDESDSILC